MWQFIQYVFYGHLRATHIHAHYSTSIPPQLASHSALLLLSNSSRSPAPTWNPYIYDLVRTMATQALFVYVSTRANYEPDILR